LLVQTGKTMTQLSWCMSFILGMAGDGEENMSTIQLDFTVADIVKEIKKSEASYDFILAILHNSQRDSVRRIHALIDKYERIDQVSARDRIGLEYSLKVNLLNEYNNLKMIKKSIAERIDELSRGPEPKLPSKYVRRLRVKNDR